LAENEGSYETEVQQGKTTVIKFELPENDESKQAKELLRRMREKMTLESGIDCSNKTVDEMALIAEDLKQTKAKERSEGASGNIPLSNEERSEPSDLETMQFKNEAEMIAKLHELENAGNPKAKELLNKLSAKVLDKRSPALKQNFEIEFQGSLKEWMEQGFDRELKQIIAKGKERKGEKP
jgi:hypothetical protein